MVFVVQVPKLLIDALHNSEQNIMICGNYNNENTITEIMKELYHKAKTYDYDHYVVWTKDACKWIDDADSEEFSSLDKINNLVEDKIQRRQRGYFNGEIQRTIVFIDTLEIFAFLNQSNFNHFVQSLSVAQSVDIRFVIGVCNPRMEFVNGLVNMATPTLYTLGLNSESEYYVISNKRDIEILNQRGSDFRARPTMCHNFKEEKSVESKYVSVGDAFVIYNDCKQSNENIEMVKL